MKNYGLPFKGSKNRLAKDIVNLLPERKHLYDLFCGGGAVTHAALESDKFEQVIMNDIDWRCTDLFIKALSGNLKDTDRWISREEFEEKKDSDSFIAFCWSFSNNMRDYIYGRKAEPVKKAMHYAIFFDDYSLMNDFGFDVSFLKNTEGTDRKYSELKKYLKAEAPKMNSRVQTFEAVNPIDSFKERNELQSMEAANSISRLSERIELESLERKNRINALSRLESAERLSRISSNTLDVSKIETHAEDYQSVSIKENSVIYCDIPYKGTNAYGKKNVQTFDYEKFYKWAKVQTEPVVISEYQMPEGFIELASFDHLSSVSATVTKHVTEKLFIPECQRKLFGL